MEYPLMAPPGASRPSLVRLCAILGILILGACGPACSGRGASDMAVADPESILWGGHKCQEARDCPSNLCSVGMCLGYLAASTEEARDTAAPALKAVVAAFPPERAGAADGFAKEALAGDEAASGASMKTGAVEAMLASALSDRSSDPYVRGRAADAFRHLPPDAAMRVLPQFLADADEPVRFFAARALAAAGDPRGREALAAFRDHPSEAIRTLAVRALDGQAVAAIPGSPEDPPAGRQGVNRK